MFARTFVAIFFGLLGQLANAADAVKVAVDSLENVAGNGSLEACGTAIHKDGIKPLMITLKHDESFYTVLSGPNDKWCVVFKRWTFAGKVEVTGTTLQLPGVTNWRALDLSKIEIR